MVILELILEMFAHGFTEPTLIQNQVWIQLLPGQPSNFGSCSHHCQTKNKKSPPANTKHPNANGSQFWRGSSPYQFYGINSGPIPIVLAVSVPQLSCLVGSSGKCIAINVNLGWIKTPNGCLVGGIQFKYHSVTIGGTPLINRPWFSNPGLTLQDITRYYHDNVHIHRHTPSSIRGVP